MNDNKMKIHITSDTHLDFWIDPKNPEAKQIRMIAEFVKYTMPESPADVIMIAGDIGHYNWQNELYFKELRRHYKHVFWVFGNHDLYMVSTKVEKLYNKDSWTRLADMIKRSDALDGMMVVMPRKITT
jgi:predicted phosphodiesterase